MTIIFHWLLLTRLQEHIGLHLKHDRKIDSSRHVLLNHQVFLCLLLVWNAGIVSDEEALSGFHSPSVLVVGTLFVMVKAVERSRVVEKAARRILGMETSFAAGLTRLMLLSLLMSAIFNSTAVVRDPLVIDYIFVKISALFLLSGWCWYIIPQWPTLRE